MECRGQGPAEVSDVRIGGVNSSHQKMRIAFKRIADVRKVLIEADDSSRPPATVFSFDRMKNIRKREDAVAYGGPSRVISRRGV